MSMIERSNGGDFAISRRGGMDAWEINEAFRLRSLRHGVSSISRILNRAQEDIAKLFSAPVKQAPRVEPATVRQRREVGRVFALEPREARVFEALLYAPGLACRIMLLEELDEGRGKNELSDLQSVMCKVRQKLALFDITPMNVRLRGYYLTDEDRAKAFALMEAGQ